MNLKAGDKFVILEITGHTRIIEIVKLNRKSLRVNIDLIYPDGLKLRTSENYYMKLDECKAIYLNLTNTFRLEEAI